MLKVEVTSVAVVERRIASKQDSKVIYIFREQAGYVSLVDSMGVVDKHPQKFKIGLEEKQEPFPVGFYSISPESLFINKHGNLSIGRLSLRRFAVEKAVSAA